MSQSPRSRARGPELVGILLIAIGVIFLLRSTGLLPLDWGALWPLILIAIGAVVVVGAVRGPSSAPSSFTLPADGIDSLALRLRLGAGTFRVTGPAEPGVLLRVDSTSGDVGTAVRRENGTARVSLTRDPGWWLGGWTRGAGEWRVSVAADARTTLDLAAGAGDFALDLLPLRIVGATISVGAAQLRVRLPKPAGEVPIRVTAGASSVTIEVPPGVEARVETSGLISVEGRNETSGYAAAVDRVTVRVDGGVSSVRVV